MRPLRVAVRNVRGALDVELHLRPFGALIGPNNAGKSTLMDAVLLFYGTLDWDEVRDLPWHAEPGGESWVEIDYSVDAAEAKQIGVDLVDGDLLRIRRWFTKSSDHLAGSYYLIPQDGGEPQPTGWTSAAKLGQCVHIPAISSMADHTSLSGPSPLRDVLLLAFSERHIETMLMTARAALGTLSNALQEGPITDLESDLDDALMPWGLSAKVDVGELSNELIMRHLVELRLHQEGTHRPLETQGSGVQRAMIAALIQAAARLRAMAKEGTFRWILFEEPEAFLHPSQVTRLAHDLHQLVAAGNTAVTITTHNASVLAAAETSPETIARVHRSLHGIVVASPSPALVSRVLADVHTRSAYAMGSRSCFKTARLTAANEERDRVLYDLDAHRAAAFFADRVIVVEGPSDVLFFEWLARRGLLAELGPNVGVLSAFGKFELHRAASTLSLFGIPHVVLWDEDAVMATSQNDHKKRLCEDRAALTALAASANDPVSSFVGAVRLTGTIERWLDIMEEKDNPWKAANIGASLGQAYADQSSLLPARVNSLIAVLGDLFVGRDIASYRQLPQFQGALISATLPPPAVDLTLEIATFPRHACACPVPAWPRVI
ncbi:ATP-dependent nuclease [Actinacidiphila sp. bgisy145]|uniref:ATP-dependent nuclease n=1 Tax=Actinacidiphila sp. bgisy145 TaxID=3413792 RepID=UPI003EBE7551